MSGAIAGPCDAEIAVAAAPSGTPHPRATLAATILGSSLAFIDGSVVNVALPAIAGNLGASSAELSWTINAYLLPLGALMLLGGGAGDHFGRRRIFLLGVTVFTLASILCAAAPTLGWLLAARFVQGLGAALLMPNSLAILGAAFTREARGRAIGIWAAAGAAAGAIGPLIGGWLVDTIGWRMIFLINLPVAAAAAYLTWAYVGESKDRRQSPSLDWAGAGFATVALGLLTWSLTAAATTSAPATWRWLAAVAGSALLGVFLWLEQKRGQAAIMPLAMFGTRTFIGITLLTFFLYGSLGGLLVLLPFFLIGVGHYSAVAAGAALLPLPIVIGLGSPLMGGLTARIGGRLPLAIGAATVAMGLALYARVGTGTVDYWSEILPATLLVAIGMGISVAPLTTTVIVSVDVDHVGAASGFNSAVARVAGLIATAFLGFVFLLQGSAELFASGFRTAALIGAASAALASGCALLFISSTADGASHRRLPAEGA
jgi:EmrB/QacA subfamily drug resistance transporter